MKDAVPDRVEVALPSHPKYLPLVRAVAEQGATLAGFPSSEVERIVLAVTEGVTNVIRHGYGGRHDRPIGLRLDAIPGRFRLEIEDQGTFVDPAGICSRPLDEVRPGGLGVHLMKATMDAVEYRENEHGGTTLTLSRRVTPDEEGS